MDNNFFIVLSVVTGLAFWAFVIIVARRQRRISAPALPSNASVSNRLGLVVGRFVGGHYGLPRTFWLYSPILGFVVFVLCAVINAFGGHARVFAAMLFGTHAVVVSVAIWRSASRFDGPKIWSWLAKTSVVAPPVLGVITTVWLTSQFFGSNVKNFDPATAKLEKPEETRNESGATHTSIDWEKGVITPPQANPAQSATSDPATDAHYKAIYKAHPDADAVANSAQFQHWLTMYPAYRTVMESGSTQQIIEMFTAFKMQRHQTFDPATARPVTQ